MQVTFLLLKQLVKLVLLPPTGPLLLALAGHAISVRRARLGRWIAVTGLALLALLSMPAVGVYLVRTLDRMPALDLANARSAQAIVILSGATRAYAAEYGGPTIGTITLERVRYGAYLAKLTHLPVLVSGGSVRGAVPEALLMRNVLVREFDVPVRWVEMRSRNTHENAVNSATILKANGVTRIVLVGHSFDFPRSKNEFRAAGMAVVPAPINIPPPEATEITDFLPSAAGLQRSYFALYEILANALFFLRWDMPAA